MYLKSLELSGFKSFATKTVLEFLPPKKDAYSVTVVVGPNGSGKSNISDAIRWVMGEQSMKQLRGKKSEDIIFSGSESKGQLGMASVSLTLDNRDGKLPIDYEELIITRRVYRSGESEYLINGSPVRLLDLQIILAKAQFAHGSYSVIGQGTIDRLLLQTPQERKEFFDEATGIKEFQIKRHQGWLKLARTKEHVAQAELLLQEISPRLKTLSRQVKKLEERQEVETELRDLQERYYLTLWKHHEDQLTELRRAFAQTEKTYRARQAELTSVQEELAALARETSMQEQFAELQARFQEAVRQKNTLEREKAVLQGRLQVEYSKAGQQNVAWMQKKIEELEREQKEADAELDKAETHLQEQSQNIIIQKQRIDSLSMARTELRGKIAEVEHQMMQIRSGEAVMQMTGLRAVQAILESRHLFGEVYGAVAQLASVPAQYQLAMDVAAGSHLSSFVVGNDRVASACIEFLRSGQLGVATFLPLNKIKPRLLPNDLKIFLDRPGVLGLAADLISFDKKFSDVFSYIFGSTIVVENLHIAREIGIGRIRMVTLEGDVLETSGSMKGGFRRRQGQGLGFGSTDTVFNQGNLPDKEKQLAALQQELLQAERSYEDGQAQLRELQTAAQIATGKIETLGARKREQDTEVAALAQELSLVTMRPEEYDATMKSLGADASTLEKQLQAAEKDVARIQIEIDRFHAEEEKKKQRVFALQDQMQEKQQVLNAITAEKGHTEVEMARLETKQEDLSNEVFQELHVSPESLSARLADVLTSDAVARAQEEIQKLKYRLSLIGGIDEEIVKEFAETKTRHEGLVSQLEDLKKAMTDLETMIAELDEIMKKKRDKAFKQIRKEFSRYFEVLFDGGKADLVEVYGEQPDEEMQNSEFRIQNGETIASDEQKDLLKKKAKETLVGIDVVANPPGKKIKNIQALSGGERTMTSIALVCAILHTNPAPFVVLDEVEAALDEANTLRFTKILHELSEQSQFVIITHNRATMHAADALYGVTMGNEGVSKLLSVKMEREML